MSSPSSPCAACKMLRRKCTQGCVFAPYFPPDDPAKFARVHQVFGASNVSKILNNVPQPLRGDAANSLAYEADARIRDPVYGCVAYILILECKVEEIRADIVAARKELAVYIGPAAFGPLAAAPRYHHPAAAQYAGVHPHHLDQQMMRHRQQKMAEARRRAATVDVVTVQGVMMGQATFYAHAEQGSSLVGPMVAAVPHEAGAPYDDVVRTPSCLPPALHCRPMFFCSPLIKNRFERYKIWASETMVFRKSATGPNFPFELCGLYD